MDPWVWGLRLEFWYPGAVVWLVVLQEASRPLNWTITESGAWRVSCESHKEEESYFALVSSWVSALVGFPQAVPANMIFFIIALPYH